MKCTESLFIVLPENFIKVKYIQFLPTPLLKYPHLSCQYLLTFGPLVVANLDQFGFSKRQELLGGGFRDRDYCRRVGGPGWQFIELTLPRSGQTLPRPGCFKDPSHPLPKREAPFPLLWICQFSEASRLRKRPGYIPPRGALHPRRHRQAPSLFGPGAGGQPGAMVWPLRTNHTRQAGNRPSNWIDYLQLRTPPTHPPALAVAELAVANFMYGLRLEFDSR